MNNAQTGLSAKIRKLLREAPSTTGELGALLGVPTGAKLNATLFAMRKYGQITSHPVARIECPCGPKNTSMWSIAP